MRHDNAGLPQLRQMKDGWLSFFCKGRVTASDEQMEREAKGSLALPPNDGYAQPLSPVMRNGFAQELSLFRLTGYGLYAPRINVGKVYGGRHSLP